MFIILIVDKSIKQLYGLGIVQISLYHFSFSFLSILISCEHQPLLTHNMQLANI